VSLFAVVNLNLNSNRFDRLPASLLTLTNLESLSLASNDVDTLEVKIATSKITILLIIFQFDQIRRIYLLLYYHHTTRHTISNVASYVLCGISLN
jgi:hypothetical protein